MTHPTHRLSTQKAVHIIKRAATKAIAVGTLGISLLGVAAVSNFTAAPVFALTAEQVSAKLTRVPVYVLGDSTGLLLISGNQDGQESQPSLFVFMTAEDATAFLTRANESNPEFAPNAQVTLTSLEALYNETLTSNEQPLRLTYIPEVSEATEAVSLNSEYQGGVPLFYAKFEDGSFVPVPQENGEAMYPMFFSSDDLEAQLSNLEQSDPEARAKISIGVLPLEGILQAMQTNDDATLNQIQLLPDSQTLNSIRQSAQPAR
jgi:hypothetical protein